MTDDPLIGPTGPPDLHVMSFNIRRRVRHLNRASPDRWSRRRWLLRRLLVAERPALLGVQEALPDQVAFVAESLGPAYRWVGRGRNPGGGDEHCTIFYDARRLRLQAWGQLALSSTPARDGSRSWGNWLPRSVTTADLTDTATGAEVRVLNTHLDHLSGRSRVRSAEMIGDLVAAADRSVVVLADANAAPGSTPYRTLTVDGLLVDSWEAARSRLTPDWGTFSRYRAPVRDGRRVDWLLVSPQVEVQTAGVNAARYDGAAPSDHEPVQAVLRLPA